MNKKFKILALSLSMAFALPSLAMASETDIDLKISNLNEEIDRLETEYGALNNSFKSIRKSFGTYFDKDGRLISDGDSIHKDLFELGNELDKYVVNTNPSLEQPMLGVYFKNGADVNGYKIRPKNANDLYTYLKNYFVLKDGMDESSYDKLLVSYVNAIAANEILPELTRASSTLSKELDKKEKEIERAKTQRKAYRIEKNQDVIKRLEESIAESELAVKTCNFLFENSPKTIAPVRDKLEKMVKDQEALIIRSKKALAKYKESL
ncbi:hypothetical protein [uncultured Anaerococcus sp.]|uniref:hypothetical protein n=1 Tax=uncultured Anaerococcus sp. TaxID=293428 RepID=UPI0025FAB35C|nr:hypothetical protein [uncultured Anaerococcus sp.]